MPLAAGSPSLALLLSRGHFVAQTEGPGPQLHVRSRQRLRAGQWHTVRGWERTRAGPREPAPQRASPLPAGVCALGEIADPAGDRWGLGPGPGGARPAVPGSRRPLAPHSLCWGPPSWQPQPQAPGEKCLTLAPVWLQAAHLLSTLGPDPLPTHLCPTGSPEQLQVQRLREETEAGWAAPGGTLEDGGGHTLLLRPLGEGPALHRQWGSCHSRSVRGWCALSVCPWCVGGGPEGGARALLPSWPLPTDTLGVTLSDVGLELEVRPQTSSSLIFHMGRVQAPPYLQLQVLDKQVSCVGAVPWGGSGLGRALLTTPCPRSCCRPTTVLVSSPHG